MTQEFIVTGMKCDGCANAVKNKLNEIDGVQSVNIELTGGKVVIESATALSREMVAEKVKQAGKYELGPPQPFFE